MCFQEPIKVHSVDLGVSAPRLYRARPRTMNAPLAEPVRTFLSHPSITTDPDRKFTANRSGYAIYGYPLDILLHLSSIELPLPFVRPFARLPYYISITILGDGKT